MGILGLSPIVTIQHAFRMQVCVFESAFVLVLLSIETKIAPILISTMVRTHCIGMADVTQDPLLEKRRLAATKDVRFVIIADIA